MYTIWKLIEKIAEMIKQPETESSLNKQLLAGT